MDYKTWTVSKLEDLRHDRLALANLPEQIAELESRAVRLATSNPASLSINTCAFDDGHLVNTLSRIDELKNRLEIAKRNVAIMDRALSQLSDEEQRILELFYVHNRSVKSICDTLYCSASSAYRVRDNALVSLSRLLFGQIII